MDRTKLRNQNNNEIILNNNNTNIINITISRRGVYSQGYKYCSRCQVFYHTDSRNCIVCGVTLRSKSKYRKKNLGGNNHEQT